MAAMGGKMGLAVSPLPPADDPTLPAVPDPEKLCSKGLGSMSSFEHAAKNPIDPSPSIGAEASLSDLSSSAEVVMMSGTLLPGGAEEISDDQLQKNMDCLHFVRPREKDRHGTSVCHRLSHGQQPAG